MHLRRTLALATLALMTAGAAHAQGATAPGGPAPAAAVERFMRLVESKNYGEMGSVFGTADGPVAQRDARPDVERRMYAVASILEHDRFVIRSEAPIPGRMGTAVRLMVDVTRGEQTVQVPFVAVRSGPNWLVEQVDLERLTR